MQELKNQEYHFIFNHFDLSTSFFIIPTCEDYLHTKNLLEIREDVAPLFVIKGEQIFNSNARERIQNLRQLN